MAWEYSTDGGATWQAAGLGEVAVNPGDVATFGSAGSAVGFRAVLTSDGTATPTLDSFALSVPGYASGKYVYSTVHEVSTAGGTTWTGVAAGSQVLLQAAFSGAGGASPELRGFALAAPGKQAPVPSRLTIQAGAGTDDRHCV